MRALSHFSLVLWLLLLFGVVKLFLFEKTDVLVDSSTRLQGVYCTELGSLKLYLKVDATTGKKEFIVKGVAGEVVAPIKERAIDHNLYLQAPPFNYSENFDNYYSKVRPLAFNERNVVKAFRYHDMIYDQRKCEGSNG